MKRNPSLILSATALGAAFMLTACGDRSGPRVDVSKDEVVRLMERVNDAYQAAHPEHGRAFWDNAAYHTGNLAAYAVTGREDYRAFSVAWAERNEWKGAKSDDRAQWKFHYGETDDFVLFGDWQIAFQIYVDLYKLEGATDPRKIARAREVMEYQMSTSESGYWWWVDALYMVMPVMTKLHAVTGDERYLDKLHEYFAWADELMFDEEAGFYFRDAKYLYPQHQTQAGRKDFWARGNGWAFAALARTLEELPADDEHRAVYLDRFTRMAAALAASQQPGGYWTRSLLDPAQAPGRETSGTAFFTFGLLWGINQGILDPAEYLPVATQGWDYLVNVAIQDDGSLGYVQPIGERAIPGQVVDQHSTAGFGVAAFLLAAAEMHELAE
jgi:unsaturated rhamnogalacturonyl hydrolase